MNILALETATSVCSVALLQDGRISAQLTLHRSRAHAENLVPMISDALEYGRIEARSLAAVAVSSGPGSYTGLRIGVSTAKGLASAVDARLVSVPSLLAAADLVRPFAVENARIAAAFDARRDESYAALFRVTSDGPLEVLRETTMLCSGDAVAWLEPDADRPLYLVGDGWPKYERLLGDVSYRACGWDGGLLSAAAVARLGSAKLARGEEEDIVTFEPYYLTTFAATKPQTTAFEKLSFQRQ